MYSGVLATHGDPGDTLTITGVDAAKTLAEYNISVKQANGMPAIAVLITVEGNNARFKFGDGASVGHLILVNGSYMGFGPQVVKNLKIGNATAGSNATIYVTVFF